MSGADDAKLKEELSRQFRSQHYGSKQEQVDAAITYIHVGIEQMAKLTSYNDTARIMYLAADELVSLSLDEPGEKPNPDLDKFFNVPPKREALPMTPPKAEKRMHPMTPWIVAGLFWAFILFVVL